MAYRLRNSVIEYRLARTFSAECLRELARDTGLVKRRRKLDAAALFWSLTLGFTVGENRSLSSLPELSSVRRWRTESDICFVSRVVRGDAHRVSPRGSRPRSRRSLALHRPLRRSAGSLPRRSRSGYNGRDAVSVADRLVSRRAISTLERNSTSSSRFQQGCRHSSRLPTRAPTRARSSRLVSGSPGRSCCTIKGFPTTGRWP